MRLLKNIVFATLYSLALLSIPVKSMASTWSPSSLVIFGDETTDNGNTYSHYHFPITPPYWHGRFSNGPTWPEYLARDFHLIADPNRTPNYNRTRLFLDFAQAFAVVDPNNISGMYYPYGGPQKNGINDFRVSTLKQQVDTYLAVNRAYKRDAIVVMWIGMHDLDSKTCLKNALPCMDSIISRIQSAIERLYQHKISHYVIITIPNRNLTPATRQFYTPAERQVAKNIAHNYNGLYYAMRSALQRKHRNIKIIIFNFEAFHNPVYHSVANPNAICYKGTYYQNSANSIPCSDPQNLYWWDEYNPTTRGLKATATGVYRKILNTKNWHLYRAWWQRWIR